MPGQGHPGGCIAVLLSGATHTHMSAAPAGESCPQTDRKAGGSRLLQRNATLTIVPPVTANRETSASAHDGRGATAMAKLASHMFFFRSIRV